MAFNAYGICFAYFQQDLIQILNEKIGKRYTTFRVFIRL